MVLLLVLVSGIAYGSWCDDDSDCNIADKEICNTGMGLCIDLDDGHVPGKVDIVDISPSVCDDELVDITVRGVYPVDYGWADNFLGSWFGGFTKWTTNCFLNFDVSDFEITHLGQNFTFNIALRDSDNNRKCSIYDDEITTATLEATTSLGIEDQGKGSCIAVPFEHTFKDVRLSDFSDLGDVELFAVATGYPQSELVHSEDCYAGLWAEDSWTSNIQGVKIDGTPPPTPDPQANPSDWTTDTTPNIFGYAVIDSDSGVDHYEYRIDQGSWVDIGTDTNFNLPSQSDGVHSVNVRAVDRCVAGDYGYVPVYINTRLNCDCDYGECCDGCYYKSAGTYCNEDELNEYSCQGGNSLGSDIYVRVRHQKCSGSSASCFGTYYYNWILDRECSQDEYCADDGDDYCTPCSTTCDYSCQSSTCYGIDPDCTSSGSSGQCNICSGGECQDDPCNNDPSLPCVDNDGCLLPGPNKNLWVCEQTWNYIYSCAKGTMADDNVYRAQYIRLCDGISPSCNGPLTLSGWNTHDNCGDDERCANDGDTSCTPVPSETCNGIDDDYDRDVDEGLTGALCPKQQGVCSGARQKCINGVWQNTGVEVYGDDYELSETMCDNKDNDCDGFVDDINRDCGVTDVGACSYGTESCATGSWTDCTAVFPTEETCDGIDSDCDGVLDGSESLGTEECYDIAENKYAGVGICSYGYYECTDSGWSADCAEDVAPVNEICDNELDDDCDGYTDLEDDDCQSCADGATKLCPSHEGVCQGSEQTCINNEWPGCDYSALSYYENPETSCFDGRDNDCDGNVDNSDIDCTGCLNGETRLCSKQDGVCSGSYETCANNEWPGCDYSTILDYYPFEHDYYCYDWLDNDCDGDIDFMDMDCDPPYIPDCYDGETRACSNQEGVCSGSYEECENDQWPGCDYSTRPYYESTETSCFDGKDNDCDGLADVDEPGCVDDFTLPAIRSAMGVAVYNEKIYLAGGEDGPGAYNTLWEFDPLTSQYTVKTSMPASRRGLRLVAVGDYLYAIGGTSDPISSKNVYRYNIAIDSWTTLASMSTARANFAAAVVNDQIYVFGGDNNGWPTTSAEVYDPALNTWTSISDLPYKTYAINGAAASDGKIYIPGAGEWRPGPWDDIIIYDPLTDSYSFGAPLSSERVYPGVVAVDDAILVVGGGETTTNIIEAYSPLTDSWDTSLPYHLAQGRHSHGVAIIGNTIYVFGGEAAGTGDIDHTEKIIITTSFSNVCTPDWIPQYGPCLIDDSQLKYYTDQNSCNTIDELPLDNGTYVYCDNSLWCNGGVGTCDDSISCTIDSCNEDTDSCDNIPDNTVCDNGLWCDGAETCDALLGCQAGAPVDCSTNDLAGISVCTNDPDNNLFTFDYFAGFTSACDETNDQCATGAVTLTHSCDIAECGAECEADLDCACEEDGVIDSDDDGLSDDYADYPDFGFCEDNCTCSRCEPMITYDAIDDEDEEVEHKVKITKALLNPGFISCSRNVDLRVGVLNLGNSEEDVKIAAKNPPLGISLRKSGIELKEAGENGASYETSFNFNLDDYMEKGQYMIKVKAYYNNGKSYTTRNVGLIVEDCEEQVFEEEEVVLKTFPQGTEKRAGADKESARRTLADIFEHPIENEVFLVVIAASSIVLVGAVIFWIGSLAHLLK